MIEIKNLSKSYGSHKALDDVSFNISRGGVVAFLGPNGAGKSTLLRILTGYLAFDKGSVSVCSQDVKSNPLKVKSSIGYLPESNPLYEELRVFEYLKFRAGIKCSGRKDISKDIDTAMELTGISHVRNRIISQLSKGYRQRVGIAESLLGDPELIILDEPMVGLDPNQLREVKSLIRNLGKEKTVFLSTHVLQDVEELCRELVIINNGKLLAVDSPENLVSRSKSPRKIYVEAVLDDGAVSAIKSLESVLSVDVIKDSGETVSKMTVETDNDSLCRNAILDIFKGRDIYFQELRLEPVKLEDIFAEFTAEVSEVG